jgi:hypothetical protein
MTCNHEKVYAPFVYTTYPAQHPWICRLCGEQGVDADEVYNDPKEYYKLIDKNNKIEDVIERMSNRIYEDIYKNYKDFLDSGKIMNPSTYVTFKSLIKNSDDISTALDKIMIETEVTYTPIYDMGEE